MRLTTFLTFGAFASAAFDFSSVESTPDLDTSPANATVGFDTTLFSTRDKHRRPPATQETCDQWVKEINDALIAHTQPCGNHYENGTNHYLWDCGLTKEKWKHFWKHNKIPGMHNKLAEHYVEDPMPWIPLESNGPNEPGGETSHSNGTCPATGSYGAPFTTNKGSCTKMKHGPLTLAGPSSPGDGWIGWHGVNVKGWKKKFGPCGSIAFRDQQCSRWAVAGKLKFSAAPIE